MIYRRLTENILWNADYLIRVDMLWYKVFPMSRRSISIEKMIGRGTQNMPCCGACIDIRNLRYCGTVLIVVQASE